MFGYNNNQGTQPRPLNKKHQRMVIQNGIQQGEMFQSDQDTVLDQNGGLQTFHVQEVHFLNCLHTILSPADLGSPCCKCARSLCRDCSSVRCQRCILTCCAWCLTLLDGLPYCRPCKMKEKIKRGFLLCLLGIHKLFSKEF